MILSLNVCGFLITGGAGGAGGAAGKRVTDGVLFRGSTEGLSLTKVVLTGSSFLSWPRESLEIPVMVS